MTPTLTEMIRANVPQLAARLRGPEIAALAARLAAAGETAPLPGLLGLTLTIPAAVAGLRLALAAVAARQATAEAEVHAGTTPAMRRRALARVLWRESTDARQRRGDMRALGRDLDLEALRERYAGEREALENQIELALQCLARALPALTTDPDDAALLRRAGLAPFLLAQLAALTRSAPRIAAIDALEQVCTRLDTADDDGTIAAAMAVCAEDPEEHPWVRAGAIAVAIRITPAEAHAICERALAWRDAPTGADRTRFLLRRLIVDRLAHGLVDWAWAPELLVATIAAGDPSEHVRMGLCRAAVAVARYDPARRPWMRAYLEDLNDLKREPSPVVRAWALATAAEVLGSEWLVANALTEETAPLTLQVACRAAERLGGVALTAALLQLAADDRRTPAIHERAAAALEARDRAQDPARAAWTETLSAALAATPVGGATVVDLRRPDLPPIRGAAWLGRILADLTRADWGVDADVREDRLTLRRGDRWRTRGWRILHELRTPSPNKRQAFPHSRGRTLSGTLRAHSGVLHEATSTGVPGERVHVAHEGGWARHLPLVDDLLGLPLWTARPVQVVSSHGVCTISWRTDRPGRLLARLRLALRYRWLADLRLKSLAADEPQLRGRYATALRVGFSIALEFTAHPPPRARPEAFYGLSEGTWSESQDDPPPDLSETTCPDGQDEAPRPLPAQLRALFPETAGARGRLPPAAVGTAAAAWLVGPGAYEWLRVHGHYFLNLGANSQLALAYFLAAVAMAVMIGAYVRRRQVVEARAAIPLVIGGWGTRGKSGTERLKAGLMHGLGHRVFAKTTGCEAMFIHAAPLGPQLEIYTFRPYGKATIWEQRALLRLAAGLRSEVFLWECMALNPHYVDILQGHWMHDDMSTITNAHPDHEDIQGPAGMDVADVIARFVPARGRLLTSETHFLPVLREAARARGSELAAIDELAGDLIAPDLLALFPYEEHPRNVALVARLGEQLGVDPTLAIVTMAEHVVPDLGVLKRFGPARLRGRSLEFLNGCSANDRTGFLSNWQRSGCDRFDLVRAPDRYLITVVNNRDDRVGRSQTFARVLVEDVAADRHLIIGTNTRGLVGYVHAALATFLAAQEVVMPGDLARDVGGGAAAQRRLDALMARLRIVPRRAAALARQLEIFARGAGSTLARPAMIAAVRRCAPWLARDPAASVALGEVQAAVRASLGAWAEATITAGLVATDAPADPAAPPTLVDESPPELDRPAAPAEAAAHFVRQVARAAVAARLAGRLLLCLAGETTAAEFHATLRAAYTALFLELLDVVDDPLTTGDQVTLRCALAVPPGVHAVLMGTQNIKGTGLDFVYRWVALDAAKRDLRALGSHHAPIRAAAWHRLEQPDGPGLLDAGLVAARLAATTPAPGEAEVHARVLAQARARLAACRAGLARRTRHGRLATALRWLEGWVDFLDTARRHRRAQQVMRDLVARRISHVRAAQVMRELDARAKGGWLLPRLRS